jgi:hypothetical protein
MTTLLATLLIAVSATPAFAQDIPAPADEHLHLTPPVPPTPLAVAEVLSIRPFVLDRGYEHLFSADRPLVDAGFIVVLRVEPDAVYPRQVAAPILMAGERTLEPLNVGYPSGVVVAILPAPRGPKGEPAIDWSTTAFHIAAPGLPEAVNARAAAERSAAAAKAGIAPLAEAARTRAMREGGELLRVADRDALNREAGKLVRRHAPDESELADALEGVIDSTPRQVTPGS